MSSKSQIDPGTIARQQLAERFSKSLDASLFDNSGNNNESKGEGNDKTNTEELIVENSRSQSPENNDYDSTRETRVASKNITHVSRVTSGYITSETLATSDTSPSVIESTSKTIVDTPPLINQDETQATSETGVIQTRVTRETQATITQVTIETQVPYRYAEPIPSGLFLQILDHGFFDLLTGVTSAAPLLFYWAFTRQQSSVLRIVYKEASRALNIPDSRISRAIDRIRTSDYFNVKHNREGLFIDLSPLIKKVKALYPDFASETLVLSSSSSLLLKETTTDNITSETLVWKNIKANEFRILVDLLHYCQYSKKDLSLKLIKAMAESYSSQGENLHNLALNLFYASTRATGSSSAKISYLLKSIKEDWGTTATTIEEIEKIRQIVSVFRVLREENVNDKSTKELRQFLIVLGKYPREDIPREQCVNELKEILSSSDDLFSALSQVSGRLDQEQSGIRRRNPSMTKYI
jgi:hypothetical protein